MGYYHGSRIRQYYSGFAANLAIMSIGTAWSWTATAIPSINSSKAHGLSPLVSSDEAWITAIVFVGAVAAGPLSGFFIHAFGLKMSMLALTAPLVGGWILIIFSSNFWMLFFGRLITGFCAGGVGIAVPVFIAETTEVEIRGKLGFGYDILGSFGQLYIFGVGYCVNWQWQSVACAIIPIVFHVLLMVVPETPRTLISQQRFEEAKKSLAWFRNAPSTDLVEEEFKTILEASSHETGKTRITDLMSSKVLRPTMICVTLMFFMQASGINAIFAYTVDIFEAAGVSDSFLATVIMGVTAVVMTCIAALCVDRVGRRMLLLMSSAIMAVNLSLLGVYLYFQESFLPFWNWIPLACLVLYTTGFAIGFGPVPFVLMGELIPNESKGISSAFIIIWARIFAFVVVFLFNDTQKYLGQYGCYWLFAGSCVIAFFYVYACVPETKGKSLQQIQLHFQKSKIEKHCNP